MDAFQSNFFPLLPKKESVKISEWTELHTFHTLGIQPIENNLHEQREEKTIQQFV